MTNRLFVHDLWVNFVKEDNYFNVPEFHEWRKEGDDIELVDQIPLLKVSVDTFNYVAFGGNQVKEIAKMVEDNAYYRKNHERIQVKYMFIMSDGERVLTVKLDDGMRVLEKSHVIPRQYQLVIEMVTDAGNHIESEYKYEISKYKYSAGLTRKEKESYKKLDEFLQHVNENDLPLIKYMLSEIDYPTYVKVKNGTLSECLEAIENLPISLIVKESANIEKLLGKLSLVK